MKTYDYYRRSLGKDSIIKIRCREETYRKFKRFAADFPDYEAALLALLEHYRPMRFL